jgi:hypothetical protein
MLEQMAKMEFQYHSSHWYVYLITFTLEFVLEN